ncbi:MAG: metal-dependent transcriptional regulator, partial [Chloroflexi bacterium]|nr:metal-dependent transcriptional regulator [Chloroflexota bacterium]
MAERTTEEYLERIGELERLESPVKTSSLAEVLGLSLGSVSEMLQRLSKRELVKYTPYAGVSLTAEGKKSFLMLTRRHRLWEVFLNKYLGIAWEDVFTEACSLEHSTSIRVTERLAQFLNNPEYCPHGCPIPDSNNRLPKERGILLSRLELGR